MSDYLHGAYGQVFDEGVKNTQESSSAIVIVGAAPVHNIEGGAENVNKPLVINGMTRAKRLLGYSDDWAKYPMCMAMHHFLETEGIGPVIMINVLDPDKHQKCPEATEAKTPSEGVITLSNANLIIVDTITVGEKVLNTDYTVAVNSDNNTVVITEKTEGALGTAELTVKYNKISVTSVSKTPSSGAFSIANAADIILDSVAIATTGGSPVTKVKGTDYTIAYDADKKTINVTGIGDRLGTDALTVTYREIDPEQVTDSVVIGTTDDAGLNTGLFCIRNVYPETGIIPAYLIVPGFSSHPSVHAAMAEVSMDIEGHWKAYMFTDIPIFDGTDDITLATAKTWKDAHGYNKENETVYFPMAEGTDGKKYYLSVLAAANFLKKLDENDGLPYNTASNTDCGIIKRLYMGAANEKRVYDDEIINRYLNKNGIASATFQGGKWVIWGAHSADYDQSNGDSVNVAETNRMMLYYIANDFQARRSRDVDKPLSWNDVQSIVAEEQARLDALVGMGALMYGKALLNADLDSRSDILNGDFLFDFNVTTTPLAKSLTAKVKWVDDGFAILYDAVNGSET